MKAHIYGDRGQETGVRDQGSGARRQETGVRNISRTIAAGLAVLFVVSAIAWGIPPEEEAKQLYNEATKILRNASGAATDPKVYAEAVFKLQKAQKLIEEAAKTNPKGVEKLQETINAALFWARKFATLPMIREIEKRETGKEITEDSPPREKPDEEPKKEENQDSAKAEELFRKAEAFERSNEGDDYAVALRWFQVADQTAGTEWSLRALSRAREAQARHKAKQEAEKAEKELQSEDAKLIAEGNRLFQQKQYEQALQKFKAALAVKETLLVHRRIGHTYVEMGYKLRDEYARQYIPLAKQFNDAARRRDQRRLAQIRRQMQILVARLRPLENKALEHYANGEKEFQKGLALAEGRSDLDCEAHLAILQFQRKQRVSARKQLTVVLKKYKPVNDEERTVYEFCKTLLKFMNR